MKKDTICRLCSACCPVEAHIEKGRLVAAERKSFLPASKARQCPKLKAAPDIVYSPDRILKPLIRDASGPSGFREASWDEALDRVAGSLLKCREVAGPERLAWLRGMAADWGAPWDYANRLMNAFGAPNTIGNGSVCHVAREMAHNFTYGAMTLAQPKDAACIVVWGKNDRNTAPGVFEAICHAQRQGARLIVIDPVKNAMAEMADLWLPVKPAHDGLLAMAMIHEIIAQDLYDVDFVSRYTTGFDELAAAARPFSPDKVAEKIWLSPADIRRATRWYAGTPPACIIDGNGLDMQLQAFQATRAVCILRALTGNIDRPGGDFIPQPVPVRDMQLKHRLPGGVAPVTHDFPLFDQFHPTWGRHAQSCLVDAMVDHRPYPVTTLVVQSGNPAVTMTDANRVVRGLKNLDFLVVIDMFMTRTARLADVILPACGCFEKTQLNRAYLRNSPVMLQDQVIECIGESRPDWQITFELGRRLGLADAFPWETVEEAIDYQLEPSGITVAALRQNPDGLRAAPLAFEKHHQQGFATPSKKVEFVSDRLREKGFPAVPFADGGLGEAISFADPADPDPLIGMSGERTPRFTHTQFHTIASLVRQEPEGLVEIRDADARRKNIGNGDWVRIKTPRGEVRMKARISDRIRPGSILIAWGWGDVDPAANVNNLTDDNQRDPVTATPSGRSFMCSLEKE
ncbi:molybdopterin-containing oxidoreductase family protein [Desulfosudis oleivorans]|uniref:Formate dehydrogenase n=1 Tax=Desulfosudis oleivorans (strain DSM 6200 / JCM 39069 / Hxd3) TaxID=96561 RepID=A8ZSM3_DESOH|nr:molybdopterin-dependent oxidoreductase [Desulfosudis oleivorans]ABW65936.1 Formate dehydrogenase [Desulfosudis oleivorans Hxd3]